jgi:Fe2+ transport system protein B
VGSDYSDDRLISFSLMQFGKCNARAFWMARFVGQLVTRLGQLVVKHSETQIAEIGFT